MCACQLPRLFLLLLSSHAKNQQFVEVLDPEAQIGDLLSPTSAHLMLSSLFNFVLVTYIRDLIFGC